MSYEELSSTEKKEIESELLKRAQDYWEEMYPRSEADDLPKMRVYSKEGLVQGEVEHRAKHEWYKKQGYWEDGRTTLEEKEKELLLKKIEFGKKISTLQASYATEFNDILERVNAMKEKVEKIPSEVQQEYGIKRDELLSQFTVKMQDIHDSYVKNLEKQVNTLYEEMLQDFERQKDTLSSDIMSKMSKLHQNSKGKIEASIKNHGAELEAELSIINVKGNDDYLLSLYQEEIKKINKEINFLYPKEEEQVETQVENDDEPLTNLNEFTVPALKQLADQRGLEYEGRIRKAELIELLEG